MDKENIRLSKSEKRHITGLFTLRRSSGSASATARSLRYAPFPRRCSGTFGQPRNATHCFIAAGKTS
jgi:hypothetical protein